MVLLPVERYFDNRKVCISISLGHVETLSLIIDIELVVKLFSSLSKIIR